MAERRGKRSSGRGELYRFIGIGFLILALGCCWLHPFWSPALAVACLGLAIASGCWPPLFFVAFPLLLVAGDAYLLTGQLVLQEYDALLLACLAGTFWRSAPARGVCGTRKHRGRAAQGTSAIRVRSLPFPLKTRRPRRPPQAADPGFPLAGKRISRSTRVVLLAALFGLGIGWLRGYWALPQRPFGDQLSVYFSQWNALRVAKGYGWAALFLWITLVCPLPRTVILRHIGGGIRLAVGYVALFVLAERFAFESLWDFGRELRVTGPFASMHVGGQHIDAFLVLAVPLIWLGTPGRGKHRAATAFAVFFTCVSVYVTVATMSRATLVIVVCQVLALIAGRFGCAGKQVPRPLAASPRRTSDPSPPSARLASHRGHRWAVGVALMAMVIVAAGLALRGDAIARRFANVGPDWDARVEHWATSLDRLTASPTDVWLGAGMGTFPYRRSAARDDGNPPLRWSPEGRRGAIELRPGWQTYLERWYFPASPETFAVELAAATPESSSRGSRIGVLRCTKTLLHSYDCRGDSIPIFAEGPVARSLNLASPVADRGVGRDRWRPESIAFYAQGHAPIEIHRWRLPRSGIPGTAESGLEDSMTSAGWAFSSDEHRHFRLFNLWVHVLFEHGYAGLGLCLAVQLALARAVFRGCREGTAGAGPVAVSLAGFVALGLFGTLLDTPWVVALASAPAGLAWVRPALADEEKNPVFRKILIAA